MLNTITIMGRLSADPELRYTQNRTPVCSFTLAVERDFGEKHTDFIDCVAWKSTAEFVQRYFRKGMTAALIGRLQLREWTDSAGSKRRSAEIVASQVYFAEKRAADTDTRLCEAQDEDDGPLPF